VAECAGGKLRVVDVDAGVEVATLDAHADAMAVLLDGRVATASASKVQLWDVGTGACVSTLMGHTDGITSLVVLADGRLASGSSLDGTVRLWDTASGTCIRVLSDHKYWYAVKTLAVLSGNQLASVSDNCGYVIRVWDTRDEADGAGGALARPPLLIESEVGCAIVPLPGNRLATGGGGGMCIWQPPAPRHTS